MTRRTILWLVILTAFVSGACGGVKKTDKTVNKTAEENGDSDNGDNPEEIKRRALQAALGRMKFDLPAVEKGLHVEVIVGENLSTEVSAKLPVSADVEATDGDIGPKVTIGDKSFDLTFDAGDVPGYSTKTPQALDGADLLTPLELKVEGMPAGFKAAFAENRSILSVSPLFVVSEFPKEGETADESTLVNEIELAADAKELKIKLWTPAMVPNDARKACRLALFVNGSYYDLIRNVTESKEYSVDPATLNIIAALLSSGSSGKLPARTVCRAEIVRGEDKVTVDTIKSLSIGSGK